MHVTDFPFELPESLIAHYPMPERSSYRLLSLDGPTGALTHGTFTDLLDKLNPDDLLVFNNTRVIPAHLFGHKASGGKIEVLVERMLDDKHILAHIRASRAPRPDAGLLLGDDENINTTMAAHHGAPFEVGSNDDRSVLDILNSIGHMPLPPYIDRPDEDADRKLYQTVYSEKPDAVAAPTAGLHFDGPSLEKLRTRGVEMVFMTLHVDASAFQPVRVGTIEDHIMHSRYTEVPWGVVDAILAAKARGSRVIAVGTTSVRSLESAAQAARNDLIEPFFDDTQIFIYPGFQYEVVDALVTNFHLLESTLIMLVSTFAGYQHAINAYKAAVEGKYRFFNCGDAMFITYNSQAINRRVGEQFRDTGLKHWTVFLT